jgi:hypothetical protein
LDSDTICTPKPAKDTAVSGVSGVSGVSVWWTVEKTLETYHAVVDSIAPNRYFVWTIGRRDSALESHDRRSLGDIQSFAEFTRLKSAYWISRSRN